MRLLGYIVLGLAVLFVVWAAFGRPKTASVRFRVTATVDVDGTAVTGSGIMQQMGQTTFSPSGLGPPYFVTETGDAIAIEVPGRSTIFLVMRQEHIPALALSSLFSNKLPRGIASPSSLEGLTYLSNLTATAELPRSAFPMIVAFKDQLVPASVYQLSPEDLSPAFGVPSRVTSITVSITRDAVTGGIEKRLPWATGLRTHLDGDPYTRRGGGLANSLFASDFRKQNPS
jgi:hypothetical protein